MLKKRYSKKNAPKSANMKENSIAALEKVTRKFKKWNFLAWSEDFTRPWVSKGNLVSSIEAENDPSFDGDSHYEDNGSNVGERYTVERNVQDLNANPSKETKLELLKVKNSKDLEET